MHTSQSICHTVGSRTCCHVVRMQCTSCTTTGSNGEVFLALLDAFFLIGTCYRMLETSRVGGVTSDGNTNVLVMHDSNTFLNVISTVALNSSTKTCGVRFLVNDVQFSFFVVVFCLNEGKTVDTGNDLSGVFSKTVQDNTQRFLTYFVSFLSDTDSTLSSCEGLMSSQEAEALCLLFQKHFTKVTMTKTYFTMVSNGTRDTESLKTFTDSGGSVSSSSAVFLDSDSCTYDVSPASVLEADRLDLFDLIINVQTGILCDLLCFFDVSNTIAV